MAVENINGTPVQGVVLISPQTGEPTPYPTGLSLEAAIALFATKEQLVAALAQNPEQPDFALISLASPNEVFSTGYGQLIPPRVVLASGGDSIATDGEYISLKAGKTYKLVAEVNGFYQAYSGGFSWVTGEGLTKIGVMGGTGGAPGNWASQSQAIAVVEAKSDMRVALRNLNPWYPIMVNGGNEWNFGQTSGSWISVEVLK